MKKKIITTAVVLALATGGAGYYFLSYAPHQTQLVTLKSLLILLMRIIKQLKNKLLILKKSLRKKLNH